MIKPQRHPGATGVGAPLAWDLSIEQEKLLAIEFRHLCADEAAWRDFLAAVRAAIRYYIQMKEVADRSSAGAVRRNLEAALGAAERWRKRLEELDGNSLQLVRQFLSGRSIKREVAEHVAVLTSALRVAKERYVPRGPRPLSERVQTAALLLEALRKHTTVNPVATEGKPFEILLKLSFKFAGKSTGERSRRDLHRLARRALDGAVTIEEGEGLLTISAPNDE